jgi:hypothetical protein
VVARVGKTHLRKLAHLTELLAENAIKPTGFVLVGAPRPSRESYGYYLAYPGAEGRGELVRSRAVPGRGQSS